MIIDSIHDITHVRSQIVKNGVENAITLSTMSAPRGLHDCTIFSDTDSNNEFSGHKGNSSLTKQSERAALSSELYYETK